MKALVVGCGSIGLRHVGHLRELGLADITAMDVTAAARHRAHERFGVPVFADLDEALGARPDAVLVATPAATHVALATRAVEAGAHVFVEKPLSIDLAGVDALAEQARTAGVTLQVGYNLRYHPAFRTIKRLVESGDVGKVLAAHAEFGLYLAKWWPRRDYRESYMADTRLSGGLLFDVSHEIDALVWFLGDVESVSAVGGKLSQLDMGGHDVVRAVLRMASGAVASLHIDCLQPTYTRTCSLVGEGTGLRWDCPRGRADRSLGRLLLFDAKANRYRRVELEGHPGDTYLEELRDFLRCVQTGAPPLVGLDDGLRALRIALAVQDAIATGETRRIR